jgi:rod shape-determining protein MreC
MENTISQFLLIVRNIFLFIRRYSTLLFFLFLQGLCIYFITNYSKYHQAAFASTTSSITGAFDKQYNKVEYYFQLSRTNDSLVKANEVLYNKLKADYNLPDSTNKIVIDTIRQDSILIYKKIVYRGAKVISNSTSLQSNYIVITGPNVKDFKTGMGVVDVNNNIVGKITDVQGEYAIIMSLLNKDSRIDGKLFGGEQESGSLYWNGEATNYLSLSNIPSSSKVVVGDSIVTNISGIFPKGLLIGRVSNVIKEKVNNKYKLSIKTAVNFNSIEYVYVVENKDAAGIKAMLDLEKEKEKIIK